MLNFETTLQDSKSYGDITLSEVEPILKINLRSNKREFSTKIGKLLSIIPPIEANTSSSNEDYSILWLSPDEWLIYSCLLYTSPSPRDLSTSRMPSSA